MSITVYTRFPERDLAGLYDYTCRYSTQGGDCTVSVFDYREAQDLCEADPQCQAVVLTNQRTWTGWISYSCLKNIPNL